MARPALLIDQRHRDARGRGERDNQVAVVVVGDVKADGQALDELGGRGGCDVDRRGRLARPEVIGRNRQADLARRRGVIRVRAIRGDLHAPLVPHVVLNARRRRGAAVVADRVAVGANGRLRGRERDEEGRRFGEAGADKIVRVEGRDRADRHRRVRDRERAVVVRLDLVRRCQARDRADVDRTVESDGEARELWGMVGGRERVVEGRPINGGRRDSAHRRGDDPRTGRVGCARGINRQELPVQSVVVRGPECLYGAVGEDQSLVHAETDIGIGRGVGVRLVVANRTEGDLLAGDRVTDFLGRVEIGLRREGLAAIKAFRDVFGNTRVRGVVAGVEPGDGDNPGVGVDRDRRLELRPALDVVGGRGRVGSLVVGLRR